MMLVTALQRGTVLRSVPARFVLGILRAVLKRIQKRHCVACQRRWLPDLLLGCVGVISLSSERADTTLLTMRDTLRNMRNTLLGMRDCLRSMRAALLSIRAARSGCVWETGSREDTPGENRLLDLRRERLRVQKNRLLPVRLRRVHERIAAINMRQWQNLDRCSGLSRVARRRMLDRAGRDGEVGGRLVIRNRQPLCRMVVMRGVRLRSGRVGEIQGRVRNMTTVILSLL